MITPKWEKSTLPLNGWKAYKDHEVEMYWLKMEPPFKPLSNDPRWQEMLDNIGFP